MIPGLIVLAVIAGLLYLLVSVMLDALAGMDSAIAAATVPAGAAVVVAVLSVLISRHLENRAALRKELREKKVPGYEQLIEFLFGILMSVKSDQKLEESELVTRFSKINQTLMIWGSDEVLASFVAFRKTVTQQPVEVARMLVAYERLILGIRRDLGHSNKGIGTGDILSLFINDIDDHLSAKS